MKRQKHIFVWVICGLVLAAALAAGITWAVRRDRAMHAALRELQEWNQADTVFRSDSGARVLVDSFDPPWHRANDRMLALYLLGRAHADMGEAPQAIEAYQTAVERADTNDADCDVRLLRNVYGQMAEVFDAQNLPEDELLAQKRFNHYSWMIGDTLQAINGFRRLERPLYLLGQYQQILQNNALARQKLIEHGDSVGAAQALITPSYIHIINHDYKRAYKDIVTVRKQANIFDEQGRLLAGNEMYYYTLGFYFDNVNELDSAEYYYRRALASNKYEAGYKGLLSVYSKRGIADSIAKFAPLYADANDASHDSLRTAEVHKTASLYNYNHHLRIAKDEQQKAERRLVMNYISIIIILTFIIVGYNLYARNLEKDRKREHALNTIRENYRAVNDAYQNLLKEHEESKTYTELVRQELAELQSQQEQLDLLTSSLKEKNKVGYYYSHDIVQGLIDAAVGCTQAPAGKMFIQLRHLFSETFPHFVSFVHSTHDLTDIEWYVCILMDLGLSNQDIAFLTGYSSSRISNIKVQISHNLFHENSSITLLKNLRAQIHPIPSKV